MEFRRVLFRSVHYDERWFLPDMAFANLKVILLNGIWKPLVFNINAQGFIPLALPRQKQSAFADTRINNQSALFNVRAYDREQKFADVVRGTDRSEEHTSELQSLMRISYAVFCLNKKIQIKTYITSYQLIISLEHEILNHFYTVTTRIDR